MTSARPLQVGVSELLRHPGSRRRFETDVVLDGLSVSTAAVPDGASIHVDVILESLSSALTATGMVGVPWQGACRRCLDPVSGEAEAEVHAEVFERHPTEGETYALTGEQIDLEPLVRDAVVLALPLAPLCGDDCRGPSPDSFPTGSGELAGHDLADGDHEIDPRWAGLGDLHFDD
ncbi:MAG: DUF177 domain-containing protein [Actinomycetes bacterium]